MKTIYRIHIILIYIIIYTLALSFVVLLSTACVIAMLWDDMVYLYKVDLKAKIPGRAWIIEPVRKAGPKISSIIGRIFTD